MGTTWSISWVNDGLDAGQIGGTNEGLVNDKGVGRIDRQSIDSKALTNALEAELARINSLMSTWDPESQLSQFNASASIEPVALHPDTLRVVDAALAISRLTSGRYDITLQPVIELWGFSRDTQTTIPDERELQTALNASGYRQLVRVGETLRKRLPAVSIDVSSLAKGFAVDRLGELAESMGVHRYIVDIGGEVRARGARGDGSPWRVGMENPELQVNQIIELPDKHIATSGSYRNFRIDNGRRLSHIIDGNTGRPIEHDLVSVSVVHDSTMLADAWATALLVVGEADAQVLMREQGLAAQLTVYRDEQFRQFASDGFRKLVVEKLD